MGKPGKRNELRLTGIALMIVAGGLVLMTCFMAVLMIDGFSQHEQQLTSMFAAAGVVFLGGIGCLVAAGVRTAWRARAASRTAPRAPDRD